jgi:hypothetical protein
MGLKRLAAAAMIIMFALSISSGSAFATERDDVIAAVHQYLVVRLQPICTRRRAMPLMRRKLVQNGHIRVTH